MVRRSEPVPDPADQDERLGEAIEAYLAIAETGHAPEPEEFAARYPGLEADLIAALEGLALVKGLVGEPGREPGGSKLETGRRVAGYRIVRELGRGGMGVVYEAVHVGLDRPVALKVLGSNAAPDSNGRRRFLNEARTAAGLHHTHIVPVFDVGQVGGLCYYAMQRIEGSGLDRVIRHLRRARVTAAGSTAASGTSTGLALTPVWLSRLGTRLSPGWRHSPGGSAGSATGPWPGRGGTDGGIDHGLSGTGTLTGSGGGLSTARADRDDGPPPFEPTRGQAYYRWVAEVGRQAAEALGYAHRGGVIHRDVKPSNLLVDGRGIIWVADFGLARRLADPGLTQHDSLLGTPRYMSPEQARTGPIDGRTDLFSLGATLYEMLTLRPPFEGGSAAELIEQIGKIEPAPPRATDPKVPRDLETIVLKLLSKRPADRYETAGDLVEDLTRFLNYEPVQARRISPIGRLWRFARRHPGISIVSTAALAAVLAVSTIAYVRVLQERDRAVQAGQGMLEAMRTQLWQSAENVRLSNVVDRRAKGLGLIRQAAGMKPEPILRSRLRDEAAEFLILRDTKAAPDLATGRVRGLVFAPEGRRLLTLTANETGRVLGIWDSDQQIKITERHLRAGDGNEPEPDAPPSGASRRRGGGMDVGGWPLIAAAGPCVAVVGSDGRGVSLLDPATGVRAQHLTMPGRRIAGLYASTDGRRLVTLDFPMERAADGLRRGLEVNLWNPDKPAVPLRTLIHLPARPEPARPIWPIVALSPDGATIATALSRETAVALWSGKDGASLGSIETNSELTALALGLDKQLATAGSGHVYLWDVETRTPMPGIEPIQTMVRLLRFSPRGSLLAVVGFAGRDVELWDTAAHGPVAVLSTPGVVGDVSFSPDGTTLAAATSGTTTSLWKLVEPDVRHRLGGFDTVTRSLSFRADGLLALGSWKGSVRFWDSGRCVNPVAPPSSHPRGDDLETETEDSNRPSNPNVVASPNEGPVSLAFDDAGRLVALDPDALRIWADPPRCPLGGTRITLPEAPGPAKMVGLSLASSLDGHVMALVRGGQVFLWRSSTPDKITPLTQPPPPARPGGRDRARDRARETPSPGRVRFGGGPPRGWRGVAVSQAGDRLYLIDSDGRFHAWVLDGARVHALSWSSMPTEATAVALRPDGRALAVGTQSGTVTLFDATSGSPLVRLRPLPGNGDRWVRSLAFAPDGRELAVGAQQGHIDLWSLDTPDQYPLRLPAHRGGVTALAYDPAGHRLASAGLDKTVDVWNLDRLRDEFSRLGLSR